MNYYEKNLGDYAKEAGHLSMAEHGAFNLLLDYYFANEKPLPKDQAYKIARARAPEERETVDLVLAEFFELQEDGCYHRQRCDEILAIFRAGEPERIVKKTNEAGRQQRFRDDRAQMFAALHAAGQFPDWKIKQPELRKLFAQYCDVTTPDPLRNASRNVTGDGDVTLQDEPATRDVTATNPQSPDTRHQTPVSLSQSARENDENVSRESQPEETNGKGSEGKGRTLTPEAAMSIPLREAGVKVTSMHPLLCAWVKDSYTIEQLLRAFAIAQSTLGEAADIAPRYLDKVLRDPRNVDQINGTTPGQTSSPSAKQESPAERERRLLRDEGATYGFRPPREGEKTDDYRAALKAHNRAKEGAAFAQMETFLAGRAAQ